MNWRRRFSVSLRRMIGISIQERMNNPGSRNINMKFLIWTISVYVLLVPFILCRFEGAMSMYDQRAFTRELHFACKALWSYLS